MYWLRSPWLLILSQALAVAGVGWVQWIWSGGVTFTLPLFGLITTLYLHQLWLYKIGILPKMPEDIRAYWGIALGWSLILVVLFIWTQPKEEIVRVAKVLPVLWLGIGLMDWVLLVCIQQLIGQQWDE